MTANATKSKDRNPPPPQEEEKFPIHAAPRQAPTSEAWGQFTGRLAVALAALEEDEYLILKVKGTDRYVQFMDQGGYGMRVESVSDYYLDDDEHLGEDDYRFLMELGWHAPTQVPGTKGDDTDGSPNYYVDLARPLPLDDIAVMAALTLANVHGARHPGELEYDSQSREGMSIRFPHLIIRRPKETRA